MNILGNGYSYEIPSTMDIREVSDEDSVSMITLPGKRGGVVNPLSISRNVRLSFVLAGYLKGNSVPDLADKLKTFTEVVSSLPEPLVIDTGDRTIRVRKQSMSIGYPPSGGKTVRVSVLFASEDGSWEDKLPVEINLGSSVKGYPVPELKAVTVSGSCETYPTILWRPTAPIRDPAVTWYGRNLVKNSSLEDITPWGVAPWMWTGSAREERYANKRVARVALNSYLYQACPCNASTTYYFSAYAASDTASTARLLIEWYNSSMVLLDSSTINYATTSALTRFSGFASAPATTAYFILRLLSTVNDVYVFITDVQAEESTTLSEYMRSQYVTFSITGDTVFSAGDVLEVDMEKRTVRKWVVAQSLWSNKIDKSNAQFFHLIPGKNLLAFSNEFDANAQVLVRYVNKYLGR